MNIGDRIRELRVDKGLSLRELGDMIGVTAATLQRYENGVITNIKPDMVSKIAQELGTTVGWLMGEKQYQPRGTRLVELSPAELVLLKIFRVIPAEERSAVQQLLISLNHLHYDQIEMQNRLAFAEEYIDSLGATAEYEAERDAKFSEETNKED